MANNHSREDFQERVRRIEARKQAELESRGKSSSTVRRAGRKISATLILGIATIGALGVLALTLPHLTDDLPEAIAFELPKLDWSNTQTSTSTGKSGSFGVVSLVSSSKRKKTPTEVHNTNHGYVFPAGYVATNLDEVVAVNSIIAGYDGRSETEIPLEIKKFKTVSECTFRPPAQNEQVRGAAVQTALLSTAVRAMNDRQLAYKLNKQLADQLERPTRRRNIEPLQGIVKVINLYVTDTEAPNYLVLQSTGGNVVWNVHLGPEVSVSHIALIGSGASGVLLPDGINPTIEALRIGDFMRASNDRRREDPDPCSVQPWLKPKPHWIAAQKAETGNMLYENQIETYAKGHHNYDRWFQGVFGHAADTVNLSANAAAHMLIGPLPAAMMTYAPLSRRTLNITEHDHIFTGDAEFLSRRISNINNSILLAAAGGDLTNLNPPIQEVAVADPSQGALPQ